MEKCYKSHLIKSHELTLNITKSILIIHQLQKNILN
jgi:hypothetical protein